MFAKKNLRKAFIIFLLTFTNLLAVLAQKDIAEKNFVYSIQSIPAFTVSALPDSSSFSNVQLVKNKPLVIMFFSPDCDHCHKQTKEIFAYKTELKNIPILMVSVAEYKEITGFYEDFNMESMPNVKVAKDNKNALWLLYRPTTFPSIYVYDAAGTLAKAYIGNVSIPYILDALK